MRLATAFPYRGVCVSTRERELGAASRCNVERGHRWFIIKMTGIKFVPTSEWQVLHRTEECAERTWERGQGAASRCPCIY